MSVLQSFTFDASLIVLVGLALGRIELMLLPLAFVPTLWTDSNLTHVTLWMLIAAVALGYVGAIVRRHRDAAFQQR
jgi:hypothetical protein